MTRRSSGSIVVMITEPASERGQIILMKGRDLWVFMPEVSQPIRIALSQRLTGQVANGDMARANFAGDYHPRLLRTETIGTETYNVLELNAVDRGVTYQKVVYWVSQKDNWPLKAEFYSLSNRLLKTCRYEKYQMMQGRQRPTQLIMEDAMRSGEQSVLEYGNMKLRDLPDRVFTKEYLKKEAEGASFEELELLTLGGLRKAVVDGDVTNGSVMAGQSAAMVKEILSCEEIIQNLTEQAEKLLKGVSKHE